MQIAMKAASRILLAAIVIASLMTGGCKRPSQKKPKSRVLLNLWHTFNPSETPTLNRLLKEARREHKDWTVQATVIPFARAQNELRRAATSCNESAPDLFRAELPWLAELVSRGLVHPVPDRLIGESGYLPEARRAARYRGKRWMLPASVDCLALLHNTDLVPTPPATLDQLVAKARRLTLDTKGRSAEEQGFQVTAAKQWGFFVRAEAYWFLPFLWSEGGALLDPSTRRIFINDPPAVRALKRYSDLVRVAHAGPPNSSPSDDYEEMTQLFGNGRVAMIVNGPWAISSLLKQPAFQNAEKLGIAPFPVGAKGAHLAPFSGHGYMVSQCARDPGRAWQLAAALAGMEAQVRFARVNYLLPALRAAYHQPGVRDNRFVSAFASAFKQTRRRPRHPAMARIFDDFTPAVQAVLRGDAQPAEALDGVARSWRRLIGEAVRDSKPGPDAGAATVGSSATPGKVGKP